MPFQRINRVLLSPSVLNAINPSSSIAIISPSANNPKFRSEFGELKPIFIECPPPNVKFKFISVMYEVSEILRMYGHWWVNRKRGTRYNYEASKIKFGSEGSDSKYGTFHKFVFGLLSRLGSLKYSWKLIDWILGSYLYKFSQLQELAAGYEQVVFVQSASWGAQDRLLAWMSKRLKWKKVMIPYTTDQLYCNGHLLLDYDSICVQGPKEEKFARHYHGVNDNKIVRLGNAWFRFMEILIKKIEVKPKSGKVICYAGCSNVYFPSEAEFLALDFLISAISRGELEDVSIMYRPLVESEEEGRIIRERYEKVPFMTIHFAQTACYSLEDVGATLQEEQLIEYLEQVSQVDLLIMSYSTTLSIDLAFLGIPTISNFVDPTGTLAKRNTKLRLNRDNRIEGIESVPVIEDMEKMIPTIKDLLYNKVSAISQSEFTKNEWDFAQTDFDSTLKAILK